MVFRFIRRMSKEQKEKVRQRLAIAYAIVSWNACAYCIYIFNKTYGSNSYKSKGLEYGTLTKNAEQTMVIRMDGFKVVENISHCKEELDEVRRELEAERTMDDTYDF